MVATLDREYPASRCDEAYLLRVAGGRAVVSYPLNTWYTNAAPALTALLKNAPTERAWGRR
jgi:hypothetical protein